MRSMPVFYEELVYAPNSGETAALYDERGEGYTSSDPEIAPTLRGLEIGDSLNDILLSIPVEVYMDYDGGTMYLDPAQITLGRAPPVRRRTGHQLLRLALLHRRQAGPCADTLPRRNVYQL